MAGFRAYISPAGRLATPRTALACALATLLGACASVPLAETGQSVQILAINDLHGNLLPSERAIVYEDNGAERRGHLGGAARMAALLHAIRRDPAHSITVAAGDLVGASPLYSAYFLDEPTIAVLGRLGLQLAAVGNHEFDRGAQELLRLQNGGCEQHTRRQPCAADPFGGASFSYLAGNVVDETGKTLLPGTSIRELGGIRVGIIGLTLQDTGKLVSPDGTRGLRFLDEADTANALARQLRDQGADEVVLLIHEGADASPAFSTACPSLSGAILPIIDKLDPTIRLIVSGHTHKAYVCELPNGEAPPRLLTSAGRYGYFVTDITAGTDPATRRFTRLSARNVPVDAALGEDAQTARLVRRYVAASREIANRVVGSLSGPTGDDEDCADSWEQDLVADAQLAAAAAADRGGAQLAFINSGGVRTKLEAGLDGSVTFGQLFAMQPFGNRVMVLQLTGGQIRAVLEQQFCGEDQVTICYSTLIPSAGFAYSYDTDKPAGERIVQMLLDGRPINPATVYRVAVNDFLASGGDGFDRFSAGQVVAQAGLDIDALETYVDGDGVPIPMCGRVDDLGR